MESKFTLFTPKDVFITTLNEVEQMVILHKSETTIMPKNRITGNEFIDLFAQCLGTHLITNVNFYEKEMGLERGLLHKIIPLFSGLKLTEWCDQYRALAAQELLATTQYDIPTIGQRIGFSHQCSFGRWFTQVTNESPAVFRKRAVKLRKEEDDELLRQIKSGKYVKQVSSNEEVMVND